MYHVIASASFAQFSTTAITIGAWVSALVGVGLVVYRIVKGLQQRNH